MARARNIKPAFFQNELLAELDPLTRLAFIGMWTIADFRGCIEFRPKRLKVQVLPYDECDFEIIGKNLERSGFISIYSVLGQRYIKIINFVKHQSPHKNERESGSEIPDIDKANNEINKLTQDGTALDKNGTTRAESLLLIPDSPILIPGKEHTPSEKLPGSPKQTPERVFPSQAGEYASELIREGVRITSQHPTLLAWIADGFPLSKILESVAVARVQKPAPEPIPAAYLNAIVRSPPAQQRQGYTGESVRDKSRRETYEQLTGRKSGDSGTTFDGSATIVSMG
jgi:hypothetical protein